MGQSFPPFWTIVGEKIRHFSCLIQNGSRMQIRDNRKEGKEPPNIGHTSSPDHEWGWPVCCVQLHPEPTEFPWEQSLYLMQDVGTSNRAITSRTFQISDRSPPASCPLRILVPPYLWSCLHQGPPPGPCSVPLWWRCPHCRELPPSWWSPASGCTFWWVPWSDARESQRKSTSLVTQEHSWSSQSTTQFSHFWALA